MPELPEVETIARQLDQVLVGKKVEYVKGMKLEVNGRQIVKVERKQKIIGVRLDNEWAILIHLKMTGQLVYQPAVDNKIQISKSKFQKVGSNYQRRIVGGHPTADWVADLPSKHTRVEMGFTDGSKLFFNDQRKFGWMRLVTGVNWKQMKESMPPDVVDGEFSLDYLAEVLSKSGRAVKLVIMDQKKIGGMGNIYANDALFLAKINPKTPANQLKVDAVKRLYQAMKQVIEKGIETGGASYSHFVGIGGMGGHYQEHFLVYDREGEKCRVCGAVIVKLNLGGRGTYYCPDCQR